MAISKDGIIGEQLLFNRLKTMNCPFFQGDAIACIKNQWCLFEVKYQELYEHPDGHGLPPRQVKARLDFEEKFGIKIIFLVFDKKTYKIHWQFLKKLNNYPSIWLETNGVNNRRVYPLHFFQQTKSFTKEELNKIISEIQL